MLHLCALLLATIARATSHDVTIVSIPPLHSGGRAWVEDLATRLDHCKLTINDADLGRLEDIQMPTLNVTSTVCMPGPLCKDAHTVSTTVDARVEQHLPRFLHALAANNPDSCLHVIVLGLSLPPDTISRHCALQRVFWPSGSLRLTFVSLDKRAVGDAFQYGHHGSHAALGLPASTMARLLLPELLPQIDTILYLDLDTLVLGSLREAFTGAACTPPFNSASNATAPEQQQQQLPLCARTCFVDNFKTWLSKPVRCAVAHREDMAQFNAGVLLLSLNHMREWGFTPFAIMLSRWLSANDQIILNLYTNGTFAHLRPDHNMYYNFEAHAVSKAVIAHSTGPLKPWMASSRWAPIWRAYDLPSYNLVWASFTTPLPAWALANLCTSAAAALSVNVHCATRNCTDQVTQLGLVNVIVTPIRIWNMVSDEHPLRPWFVAHALMKVWYGSDYPHLFDLTIRLAILYEGGVVLDVRSVVQQQLPVELLASAWCVADGVAWVTAAPHRPPFLATALKVLAHNLTTYESSTNWREHIKAFFMAFCGGSGDTPAAVAASLSFNAGPIPHATPAAHFAALWLDLRTAYLHRSKTPGVNLGDEVQGLAALQWLPFIDSHVERDDLALTKESPMQPNASTIVFLNGWYGTNTMTWPPAPNINPIMLAIHIEQSVQKLYKTSESVQYFKQHAPIGARDTATLKFLTDLGVPSFLSYCMTLTFQHLQSSDCPVHDAVVVDVSEDAVKLLPASLKRTVASPKYLDNGSGLKFKGEVRYWKAFELLRQSYGCTRVLVTSRLHAALPALAMGVPVALVLTSSMPGGGAHSSSKGNSRFSGLQQLLHSFDFTTAQGRQQFEAFPWHDPPPNPGHNNLTAIRCNIYAHIKAHHNELLDAIQVFDASHVFTPCEQVESE